MTEQAGDVGRRLDLPLTRTKIEVSWLLAVLSGLLLTAVFPPLSAAPLLFFALVPLLWAIQAKPWREGVRLGFVAGLVHFGTLVWWLAPTVARFGNLPGWAAWPVVGLLCCYLALYPALWAGLMAWRGTRRPPDATMPLTAAAAWVVLEWVRGHLLSGFPWGTLAYALDAHPLWMQTVDLWGPYGLSFLLVVSNTVFWLLLRGSHAQGGTTKRLRICWALAVVGLWMAAGFYGHWRMGQVAAQDKTAPVVDVALIQGAIPQESKWDPAFQEGTLDIYGALSEKAVAEWNREEPSNGTSPIRIVVWPETAAPFYFQEPGPLAERIVDLSRHLGVPVLFGSPAYRYRVSGEVEYLNSAYLVGPEGRVLGRYDKRHLVPFGEYLPWGWLTAWAQAYLPSAGQFSPGDDVAPLAWQQARIGVLICFESIFPSLSRQAVKAGANILAVITNDAWFGRTGAPYQHEAMAVFRAVETRRWVVRAANTGISSIISPEGERTCQTPLFERVAVVGQARLRHGTTAYGVVGDAVPVGLSAVILLGLFMPCLRKFSGRRT